MQASTYLLVGEDNTWWREDKAEAQYRSSAWSLRRTSLGCARCHHDELPERVDEGQVYLLVLDDFQSRSVCNLKGLRILLTLHRRRDWIISMIWMTKDCSTQY